MLLTLHHIDLSLASAEIVGAILGRILGLEPLSEILVLLLRYWIKDGRNLQNDALGDCFNMYSDNYVEETNIHWKYI